MSGGRQTLTNTRSKLMKYTKDKKTDVCIGMSFQ
nr:MAG TPA: hypothetical protein [Caudoviricetes sp.]